MKKAFFLIFLVSLFWNHLFIGMDLAIVQPMEYALETSPRRSIFLDYIKHPKNNINHPKSPYLCIAAMCNDKKVVQILLERSDVKLDVHIKGHTALEYACTNNNHDIEQLLLGHHNNDLCIEIGDDDCDTMQDQWSSSKTIAGISICICAAIIRLFF